MSNDNIPSSPPLFSHKKGRHRKGYQKCVEYVGIDKNDDYFGEGFPLCAVIKFKRPIYRYTPRTHEIARLLATLKILYGEEYMEELFAWVELEYVRMRRRAEWLTHFGNGSD
ncbi:hypothetical protein DRN52_06505 [Thermococci archaeon]|nr:MAG: hypothetical protein DRN52_06505 [Thermococci archaeon]